MKHQLKRQKRRRQGCKRRQTGSTGFRFEAGVLHLLSMFQPLVLFAHVLFAQVSPWYPSKNIHCGGPARSKQQKTAFSIPAWSSQSSARGGDAGSLKGGVETLVGCHQS